LHYPGEDKIEEFEAALKRKASAQDFDFRGVWFPVDFTVFQGIEVTDELRFDNAIFKKPVDFTGTVFKSAMHFQSCHFEDWARFTGAKFEEGVSFNDAHFKVWGDFTDARMNGLGVYEVHAKGELSFDRATLSNDVHIVIQNISRSFILEDLHSKSPYLSKAKVAVPNSCQNLTCGTLRLSLPKK
jgi:hypothetical protein